MSILFTDIADRIRAVGAQRATLHSPGVRISTVNAISSAIVMDWQATVWMSITELDNTDICVGTIDFLTVRCGDTAVADVLDEHSEAAVPFIPLFDGRFAAESVSRQFGEETINSVLLIVDALLQDGVQGRNLGPWAATEVIHWMLPSTDGLVAAYPSPLYSSESTEAIEKLTRTWQKAGMEPLTGHPGILGQHSAYTHLADARHKLRDVSSVSFAVDVDFLESWPEISAAD
ncbi:hypothetical protein [Nocardia tengchongensis]|uniref:hypothetical protein n=1 Tax=Nocardia tengchongensis TaxID=2055889 RepID=UPI0036865241